jgi:hypothetical protein
MLKGMIDLMIQDLTPMVSQGLGRVVGGQPGKPPGTVPDFATLRAAALYGDGYSSLTSKMHRLLAPSQKFFNYRVDSRAKT